MINQKLEGSRFDLAVVGFGGEPTLWWMRFLKKGYYHCLVAIKCQKEWLLIDPLLHCIDIVLIKKGNIRLYLKKHGYKTLDVNIKEPVNKLLRVSVFTCVETVKRIIGIQKRSVITPYGLFKYLKKINKEGLDILNL